MALHIYRYELTSTITDKDLHTFVDSTACISASSGGIIIDIQVDDSHLDDLDYMLIRNGYVRVETDPVGMPVSHIHTSDGVTLTYGVIGDGQLLKRNGTTIIGVDPL